jgi:ABC-type bacteriocin/lantibiotic exporter with double-glycine peptidase domain
VNGVRRVPHRDSAPEASEGLRYALSGEKSKATSVFLNLCLPRLTGRHDQIEKMPMGGETPVGESALSLSGGERHPLALARAPLNAPRILILDEATSHLDVQTVHAIHRNLKNLNCMKIVIAHRLTTVRTADNILVTEQGGIARAPAE